MSIPDNSMEKLPIDHWQNYIKLAELGLLRIDQLFQKAKSLDESGMGPIALDLYKAYVSNSKSEKRHMALYNYGALQQANKDIEGAEESYKACIELEPSLGQAVVNLGLLLERSQRKQEALIQWHRISDPPENGLRYDIEMQTMALNHIGRVYENHKQYEFAEKALERSLLLNPKQTGVLQHWIHIRQKSCSWPIYKELAGITHNEMLMATSPLAMLALTDDPVQLLLTAHAFVGRTYGFKEEFLSKGRVYKHDKLRIGYVSGDLCTHAVGLLLDKVFDQHDRSKVDLYAYDFSPEDGTAVRAHLKNSFYKFHSIHQLSDRLVAEQILTDEIDVLIDLHGLSSGARPGIFALHPAPKQGTYLGFIGTTAMPWFEFVIADKYVLPEELTKYFTEKPHYVNGCFIPLSTTMHNINKPLRSKYSIPENSFVLVAFGNVYKITPEMFDTWLEILKQSRESILWLIDDNPVTTRNLKTYAESKLGSSDQILFSPRSSHSEYKEKLLLADLFLDSFPYNCGSTSNDVISLGVPMITLSGRSMVSRMGGSILKYLGMNNMICTTHDEYIIKTLSLIRKKKNKDENVLLSSYIAQSLEAKFLEN
jgi:predicted O-linked N-acetylglucosamine transferase (SPINDLY family)